MLALKEKSIDQVMTRDPRCIEPHQSIVDAEEVMRNLRVTHLPVRSQGTIVGILSQSDVEYLKSFKSAEYSAYQVSDVMLTDPYSVKDDTPIREVAEKMYRERIGSTLVNDAKGKLVGIFTANDALKILSH